MSTKLIRPARKAGQLLTVAAIDDRGSGVTASGYNFEIPMRQNNSAFVLVSVVILAALGGVLAAALLYSTGSQITRVSREIRYEKAFFIAEAGVELAKAELRSEGVSSFNATTNFGGGESRYQTIMTTPSNVIIWSTGTYEQVSRVLEVAVLVDPGNLPPPATDGAVGIYGTNTLIDFSGNASFIDGQDYSLPTNFDCNGASCVGAVTTNPATPGVFSTESVNITPNTNLINSGVITNGSSQFSTNYWQDLAEVWSPQATITLAGTYASATDLGTRDNPQITLVTGDTTITSNLEGAGVLIVMNGINLTLGGNFHYEGIVILLGNNLFNVTGTARVFGALVTTSQGVNIQIKGNPEILYSSQALGNLQNLQMNPRSLSVIYWREAK